MQRRMHEEEAQGQDVRSKEMTVHYNAVDSMKTIQVPAAVLCQQARASREDSSPKPVKGIGKECVWTWRQDVISWWPKSLTSTEERVSGPSS